MPTCYSVPELAFHIQAPCKDLAIARQTYAADAFEVSAPPPRPRGRIELSAPMLITLAIIR